MMLIRTSKADGSRQKIPHGEATDREVDRLADRVGLKPAEVRSTLWAGRIVETSFNLYQFASESAGGPRTRPR